RAPALGGQDGGEVDAVLLEEALVERDGVGRAVEQRGVVGDDDVLGAGGAGEAKAEGKRSRDRAKLDQMFVLRPGGLRTSSPIVMTLGQWRPEESTTPLR